MGVYSFKSSGKTSGKMLAELTSFTPLPVGISTPLKLDNKNLFVMHYSVADQVHDNLRNLLLTNWGERVGFYYFGANLRELTADFSSIELFDEAAIERIRKATSMWMPFISLNDFVSETDSQTNKNTGIIRIKITYNVSQLNVENKALQISLYVI